MMERKHGFDDSSPGDLRFPSFWVTYKKCLYLPKTQEKPGLHIECQLDKQVKLAVPTLQQLVAVYISNINQ
jgi:hypothetical protein